MLGPFGLGQLTALAHRRRAGRLLRTGRGPAGAGGADDERVTKHTDGDTLWLSGIGKVRLIGMDTPEVFGQVECFGREASAFVERPCRSAAEVRYRLGVEERDRYGRALAYVWLRDGRFLNRLLVARGYAPAAHGPAERGVRGPLRAGRATRARGRPGPLGPAGVQRLGSPACCGM